MRANRRPYLYRAIGGLALFLVAAVYGAAQVRVVAIGDVHGAYPEFVTILQRTGLIDGSRKWAGGSSVLVQTGDIPDRGPRTRDCLDLLMELEREAEKQNGKVLPLLGNHEVMIMMGDLRYVSREDFRGFATAQSEQVREQAFSDFKKFLSGHSGHHHSAAVDSEAARQKWMDEHPVGYFEQRDAFAPQGVYGRWLRKHDTVAQVGDVIFLHGGLDPKLRFRNIQQLNDRVRSELANFDALWQSLSERKIIWRYMNLVEALRQAQEEEAAMQSGERVNDPDALQKIQKLLDLQKWMAVSPDGPLWYRGYAQQPEPKLDADLEAMMARLKVRHIVVGHTVVSKTNITPHFGDRVFMIDTGMLKEYFGGRASALEIQNGSFIALYAGGEQQVLLAPEKGGSVPALSHGRGNGKQEP